MLNCKNIGRPISRREFFGRVFASAAIAFTVGAGNSACSTGYVASSSPIKSAPVTAKPVWPKAMIVADGVSNEFANAIFQALRQLPPRHLANLAVSGVKFRLFKTLVQAFTPSKRAHLESELKLSLARIPALTFGGDILLAEFFQKNDEWIKDDSPHIRLHHEAAHIIDRQHFSSEVNFSATEEFRDAIWEDLNQMVRLFNQGSRAALREYLASGFKHGLPLGPPVMVDVATRLFDTLPTRRANGDVATVFYEESFAVVYAALLNKSETDQQNILKLFPKSAQVLSQI